MGINFSLWLSLYIEVEKSIFVKLMPFLIKTWDSMLAYTLFYQSLKVMKNLHLMNLEHDSGQFMDVIQKNLVIVKNANIIVIQNMKGRPYNLLIFTNIPIVEYVPTESCYEDTVKVLNNPFIWSNVMGIIIIKLMLVECLKYQRYILYL